MNKLILNKDHIVLIGYKHETVDYPSETWGPAIFFFFFLVIKSVQKRLNISVKICSYCSALFCFTPYPFMRPSIHLLQVPSPQFTYNSIIQYYSTFFTP